MKYRFFFWSVLSAYLHVFSPNAEKYGPEKNLYLDTFHAVKSATNLRRSSK